MTLLRLRREFVFLIIAVVLGCAATVAFYLSQATTLTIAVAPAGGSEPTLIAAYADALARERKGVRLRIKTFEGVRESAEALQAGQADLAVVRPDVFLPDNGLTLAILRTQALLIAAPDGAGIKSFPDLTRKRLGILAHREVDQALIRDLAGHYGLDLVTDERAGPLAARTIDLLPIEEADLGRALIKKRVDAVALLTTPTTPLASRVIGLVRSVSLSGKVSLFGAADSSAIIERFPHYQSVTVTAGLFGGSPKTPGQDVDTVGASYRLMARSTLSRSEAAAVTQYLFEMRSGLATRVPSANAILAPSYDTTVAATSAKLPIHPGAIDYYEREQESFIERYETWIYLVAFLGGGLGSTMAWLRQRLSRLRRERVGIATGRLLEIQSEARRTSDPARLHAFSAEIDDLAAEVVRHALDRPTEARTISAAAMAVDAARSTVTRSTEGKLPQGLGRDLRVVD